MGFFRLPVSRSFWCELAGRCRALTIGADGAGQPREVQGAELDAPGRPDLRPEGDWGIHCFPGLGARGREAETERQRESVGEPSLPLIIGRRSCTVSRVMVGNNVEVVPPGGSPCHNHCAAAGRTRRASSRARSCRSTAGSAAGSTTPCRESSRITL